MTVPANKNKVTQNGDGSTATFSFDFPLLQDDDMTVQVESAAGVITTLASSKYTLSYTAGDSAGGSVTITDAASIPASGEKLVLVREVDPLQESDYRNTREIAAETIETDFDRLTMIAQQFDDELDRSIKLSVTSSYSELTIPDPEDGKVIAWKSDLSGFENITNPAIAAAASASAAATSATEAGNAQTAAEAAQTAAETAETNAETAETNAETAETNAEAAETNAAASAAAAYISEINASASETAAYNAQIAAEAAETNAAASATSAYNAQIAAEAAETNAAASAAAAYSSEINAAASETAAYNAQIAAETAETNAEAAAALVPDPTGETPGDVIKVNATSDGWEFGEAGVSGTRNSFTNSDLSTGELTVTHSLGLSDPYTLLVEVADNNDDMIIPDDVTFAANSFTIDLTSYGTITGIWSYYYI